MGLKSYPVTINGMETVLRLSDADAKKQGLTRDEAQLQDQATTPPAKKTTANKAAPRPNKARSAQNKA